MTTTRRGTLQIILEIEAGANVNDAAADLVDLANVLQAPLSALFNDTPLEAKPGDERLEVVRRWSAVFNKGSA